MFDEKTMYEMGQVILQMTPEQRRQRAEALSKLLDEEMKRRNLAPESPEKRRGRVLQWMMQFRNVLTRH